MTNKSLCLLLASASIAFCSTLSALAGGMAVPDQEPEVVIEVGEPDPAPITEERCKTCNSVETHSGDGARICGMRGQAFVCTN